MIHVDRDALGTSISFVDGLYCIFPAPPVGAFSSCPSFAISSSRGLGRARAVTSISSKVATRHAKHGCRF